MRRVVVTGAAGLVGRSVVSRLADDAPDTEIVAIDRRELNVNGYRSVVVRHCDLGVSDLAGLLAGASTIVHLATVASVTATDSSATGGDGGNDLAILRRVLDAAGRLDVDHVVVLSSAAVYGAHPDNPVPLTEDAPPRPNDDFDWANERLELERLAQQWGLGAERHVTVLRPTSVVANKRLGHFAAALRSARTGVAADSDAPVQYLHVDDLATAIVAAVVERFDGVLNVAPNGWISPETMAELEGPKPRLRLPSDLVRRLASLVHRAGLTPVPPAVVTFTEHPWVVANDRLRLLGWRAAHSNEEAWVQSHAPLLIESLPARRRQEIALVAAAATLISTLAVLVSVLRRIRKRRRRSPS